MQNYKFSIDGREVVTCAPSLSSALFYINQAYPRSKIIYIGHI